MISTRTGHCDWSDSDSKALLWPRINIFFGAVAARWRGVAGRQWAGDEVAAVSVSRLALQACSLSHDSRTSKSGWKNVDTHGPSAPSDFLEVITYIGQL